MIYSLNYGDLLKRQAELQRLGNMPEAMLEQVDVALLTEIGELAQELKPDWAWWKKPGSAKEVNRERVLSEAADVLHFALLLDLASGHIPSGDCVEITVWHTGQNRPIAWWIMNLLKLPEDEAGGLGIAYTLCTILARYGFTPADLARAYWEKTEVNLERWRKADAEQP